MVKECVFYQLVSLLMIENQDNNTTHEFIYFSASIANTFHQHIKYIKCRRPDKSQISAELKQASYAPHKVDK
jgi:hypothetical protein